MGVIECFVDPTCPWCRVMTTWIRSVREEVDLEVRWRFLSLALLDDRARHQTPQIAAIHARGAEHLALLAAVRRLADEDAVDRTLEALGGAVWNQVPATDPDTTSVDDLRAWAGRALDQADLLASAGVDPAIAAAVSPADHATVAEDTWTAVGRVGTGLGAPVVTLAPPTGPSFFGPVVSSLPATTDEAVRLWEAFETLARQPGLAELRTRHRASPDLPLAHALASAGSPVVAPRATPSDTVAAPARDTTPVIVAAVADPSRRAALAAALGDRSVADELHAALTLGAVDYYAGQPWSTPEEELYPVLGEALRVWVGDRGDQYDKVVILDEGTRGDGAQLLQLLQRNGVAARIHTTSSDPGRQLQEGPLAGLELPAVRLWDGRVLERPTRTELAETLGGNTRPRRAHYDVAIVGGGPAGLAAAVYAGSEGLQAAMIEQDAIGGQAGTSTQIRNYPGFPWSVRGADLALRASRQADQFGVEEIVTHRAVRMTIDGSARLLELSSGDVVRCSSVVLACGMAYRRLGVAAVDELVGRGVFYGAGASEAAAMGGRRVCVLGGGNSAGQAAAHLAASGATVEVLLRGDSLGRKMSEYLVRKLEGTPGLRVRHNVRVTGAHGERQLTGLELTDTSTGAVSHHPCDALFVFIGTRPHTGWLDGALELDDRGFVVTGRDGAAWLETSVPNVFAAGDVRAGSVKRVAAAVGEGSSASMLALARSRQESRLHPR